MFKYFISREFGLTLIGLGLVGLLAYLLIFFVILPAYTRHGDSVLVPEVNEISHEEALDILKDAGLRGEVRDCTYIADLPALTVIAQYPVPLSRVKPNRKVFLTLNQRRPPMVRMPEVVDISLFQAKARLESWKLEVGTVTLVPDVADNMVLKANINGRPIRPGEMVPQGSRVDLVVGDGGGGRADVDIPNLIGMTYAEALAELRLLNLGLGRVFYNPDGPPEEMGLVYDQNPQPVEGDVIKAGSPVNIFVYGEEPESQEGVDMEVEDGFR
jgi:beta-lactam-binding protein with PASTA domain